ncbi:MATE family efflux transporter [Advenella mimigardefordensis]|uniref:Putative MATE efflux family protein n=1 Tax=Advenella mimigardefordensis (strain DSM 17166 / LMG 22922 / DPN7) TaxID=1247726 RepID=W0PIM6_ADVMD|nr:MATE family efflux transporter [Advenella mimigardefordensis]AHG65797.1 putative MATE efflux family protein [Advenella mimigardefordensis DPN7]
MKVGTTVKEIAFLAWPLVLMQLASIALTTTDLIMMGMLGPTEIAAGGIAITLFGLLRTSSVGLVTPAANLFAQTWARGGVSATARLASQVRLCLLLATACGALMAAVMLIVFPLLRYLGQDPQLLSLGYSLLIFLAPSLIPLLWLQVLRNATVALKRPGPLMLITLIAVAINIGLNLLFVFGVGSWTGLGLPGVGLATLFTQTLMAVGFYVLVRRDSLLAPVLRLPTPGTVSLRSTRSRLFIREVARLGLPTGAAYASEAGFVSVLTLVAGTLGAASLAAHTLAFQYVNIAFMVAIGLSHAVSIHMSHALPERDTSRLRLLARAIIWMGFVAMGIVAIIYVTLPETLIGLILKKNTENVEEVLQIAVPLLALAALLQFADCQQNLAVGAMRGILKARDTFVLTMVGYWLIGVPVVLVFTYVLHLGVNGIWLGFFIGLSATALLLWRRFYYYVRQMEQQPRP